MNYWEEITYLNLADRIISRGDVKNDRTGVGTRAIFGAQHRYDIFNRKLPIVTTRKIKPLDPIIEMLWFIAGDTDIAFLKKHNINIWDSWVREETKRFDGEGKLIGGSIGPGAYGAQWRNWEDTRIVYLQDWIEKYKNCGYEFVTRLDDTDIKEGGEKCVITRKIDQLATAIEQIKNTPDSRRIIVSAWNPGKFEDQALLPCHMTFQFYTAEMSHVELVNMLYFMYEKNCLDITRQAAVNEFFKENGIDIINDEFIGRVKDFVVKTDLPTRRLSLHLLCRSQDFLVGTAYNVLQYSALTHMVAQVTNTWADEFLWTGVDVHVYSNQFEPFQEQHPRIPLNSHDTYLKINSSVKDIDDFESKDFEVIDYKHHPFIKYPIAV